MDLTETYEQAAAAINLSTELVHGKLSKPEKQQFIESLHFESTRGLASILMSDEELKDCPVVLVEHKDFVTAPIAIINASDFTSDPTFKQDYFCIISMVAEKGSVSLTGANITSSVAMHYFGSVGAAQNHQNKFGEKIQDGKILFAQLRNTPYSRDGVLKAASKAPIRQQAAIVKQLTGLDMCSELFVSLPGDGLIPNFLNNLAALGGWAKPIEGYTANMNIQQQLRLGIQHSLKILKQLRTQ
jgi:hypothetical protein